MGILLASAVGCSSQTVQYQVSVVNHGAKPITVWLLKEHSGPQKGWASPEQVAMSEPATDNHLPDVVVPPGKTATRPTLLATFENPHGRAVLRVYDGTPTLTEMLAINRGDQQRLDLVLEPGLNAFIISDEDGAMNVTRENPTNVHP